MSDIRYGRKTKGIRLELEGKINDWIESISDKNLRDDIYRDAIVTGGSICSMLMGEKVNDYDVYFKTPETVKKVAEYYASKVNFDVNVTIGQGEFDDKERIRIEGDYPMFDLSKLKDHVGGPYSPIFLSTNAITLSDDIQIITRFYGNVDEVHRSFDFVHATCSYDVARQELETPEKALLSMLSRCLVYTGSLYPVASIFRMKKFIQRGWRIGAGEQLKIMFQISELPLHDVEVLREQLVGVDLLLMSALIDEIKSCTTDIDSGMMIEFIDKVFE